MKILIEESRKGWRETGRDGRATAFFQTLQVLMMLLREPLLESIGLLRCRRSQGIERRMSRCKRRPSIERRRRRRGDERRGLALDDRRGELGVRFERVEATVRIRSGSALVRRLGDGGA
jgi:hypothetical protein